MTRFWCPLCGCDNSDHVKVLAREYMFELKSKARMKKVSPERRHAIAVKAGNANAARIARQKAELHD